MDYNILFSDKKSDEQYLLMFVNENNNYKSKIGVYLSYNDFLLNVNKELENDILSTKLFFQKVFNIKDTNVIDDFNLFAVKHDYKNKIICFIKFKFEMINNTSHYGITFEYSDNINQDFIDYFDSFYQETKQNRYGFIDCIKNYMSIL